MQSSNYLMDNILHHIFKTILYKSSNELELRHELELENELERLTDNLSKMIYVNKIENRVTFKIKTEYSSEALKNLEALKLR